MPKAATDKRVLSRCHGGYAGETISGQDVHEIVKYNRILSDEERAELEPESVPPSDSGEPEAEPPVATEESKAENVIDDGDAPFPDPSPA